MLIGFNAALLIACIVLTVLVATKDSCSKGLITAGRIVGIGSIVYSVIQQFLTFFIGGLLLSLSDGNGLSNSASSTYFALLLIPVAIIAAAIILLVVISKNAKKN